MVNFIWNGGGTKETAERLAEKLNLRQGQKLPDMDDVNILIGWGCSIKEGEEIEIPEHVKIINHPNAIQLNRRKYDSLVAMRDKGVKIKPFAHKSEEEGLAMASEPFKKAMDRFGFDVMSYPMVGRKAKHQEGNGFWLILDESDLKIAIKEGAEYFRNYFHTEDEYRLHVFGGEVIHAVRKVAKYGRPDRIIRSNRKGWKFVTVKEDDILPRGMSRASIEAVNAVGMDFGAVDATVDIYGRSWIIEVNSGPGLTGVALKAWVSAFEKAMERLG